MSDLVKRLREHCMFTDWQVAIKGAHEAADRIAQLEADNTRLRVENIQMQAALGYAICAEDERHIIPSNPFKCGVCDANRGVHDRIAQLEAALREIDQARYTGRNTINPDNAFEHAISLNEKLIAVMDIARAALEERT